ncbi:hypothetical protein L208DRAFT_1145998, partial [Tricholoma matsutake]
VTLDLFLPLTNGRGFKHCFVGSYAPWDPGLDAIPMRFWPLLTRICNEAPGGWTIAGDLNATLLSSERAS